MARGGAQGYVDASGAYDPQQTVQQGYVAQQEQYIADGQQAAQ